MKKFLFLSVVGVAVVFFFVFRNRPEVQKLEKTTRSELGQTQRAVSDAVKEGAQKANGLATNAVKVAKDVEADAQEANKAATNAMAKAREVATNAVIQIKEKVGGTNQ